MSKFEKLIQKVFDGRNVSYEEAETILKKLGFDREVTGSHHIFRKKGYQRNVSLKKRAQLLNYQIKLIEEILKEHEY